MKADEQIKVRVYPDKISKELSKLLESDEISKRVKQDQEYLRRLQEDRKVKWWQMLTPYGRSLK